MDLHFYVCYTLLPDVKFRNVFLNVVFYFFYFGVTTLQENKSISYLIKWEIGKDVDKTSGTTIFAPGIL